VPPILPPSDGFLLLDRVKFAASFAGDVNPDMAAFMADSQVPWGLDALGGAVSEPAWKSRRDVDVSKKSVFVSNQYLPKSYANCANLRRARRAYSTSPIASLAVMEA
jgi:hypothetical protein